MEHVVQRQSNKLYTLKTATSRLERTLRYQNHLVQSQTIPKNYSPKNYLETDNIQLQNKFDHQFKELFLNHLSDVVNENTIALELKRARLETEIGETEMLFINSTEDIEILRSLYQQFLANTGLQQVHKPSAAIKRKLQLSSASSTINNPSISIQEPQLKLTTRSNKRKNKDPHPICNKRPNKTTQHFLEHSPPMKQPT